MRILYFSRGYTTHDRRFLEAIASRHEVNFLPFDESYRLEQRPLPRGVATVESIPRDDDPVRWLRRCLHELRPDLVHAGPIQTCARIAAEAGVVPLVAMSWGSDMLIDSTASPELERATVIALRGAAGVVVDCDAVRHATVPHLRPGTPIAQLPWGLELASHPDPGASGARPLDEVWLLSTRTWSRLHGVDAVVAAFVMARRIEPNLRLRMVGDGPLKAELSRITAPFVEDGTVLDVGRVAEDALRPHFLASDVYVSASQADGTSISLLEAMAARLPALLTDVGGNREWIEDGDGGWLVARGDVQALARAMVRAARDRERPRRGAVNRLKVEKCADWHRNVERLFELYERLGR